MKAAAMIAMFAIPSLGFLWIATSGILFDMRNRKGLYGWPKWVQVLICLADRIPLSAVGEYPNQQASNDHIWAHANPDELNTYGLSRRAEARERLGLD